MSNSGFFGTTSPVNTTELQAKYEQQTTKINERFDSLGVAYSGLEQSGGLVSSTPPAGDIGGCYFYHPDHLGSSSLITDGNGHLVQHIQYVPFGEVFLEQRSSNSKWSTPYKFNGKELDEETGLAYYHARYYDPRTSVWLSVDPLAEKMPGFTSYHYCSNNPIMRIDPDGRSDEEVQEGNVRIILNLGGGHDIDNAAKTRKRQIEKQHPGDKLIYIDDNNLGNLKSNVEDQIKLAVKEGYGKTVELSVFGHNGETDGPRGKYDKNNVLDLYNRFGDNFGRGQIGADSWSSINFNFNEKSSFAAFYGCKSSDWAEKFLNLSGNVKHTVGIGGQAGGTYNTNGKFKSSIFNIFNQDVFLRSADENAGYVDPLYLYTRGSNSVRTIRKNPTIK